MSNEGTLEPKMELKEKIAEHYDNVSPYYFSLWGSHIHHGFWITGTETKEEAQSQLLSELARRVGLTKDKAPKVLDVGCGVGGGSLYLAKNFNATVVGITISSKQVEMAREMLEKEEQKNVKIMKMDAENITLEEHSGSFDYVWIVEAMSHFGNKKKFISSANKMLKVGGRIGIADWFKSEHLCKEDEDMYIQPIVEGMLLPELNTMFEYMSMLHDSGFRIVFMEDISEQTKATWDICLDLIQKPSLWKLAFYQGREFVGFLKAFQSMRNGFHSKKFIYGMIVAEKVKGIA